MKYIILICVVFVLASLVIKPVSSIYGTIEPAESAAKVFAIKGTDTLVVIPEAGKFSVAVTGAGKWKLYVQAISPYKDAVVDNLTVEEGRSTDAGIIKLLKMN